jgi:class 3 adenylate cyclase
MEFFKLRWKIFLSMALVVIGLLAATQFVSNRSIDAESVDAIRAELLNSRKNIEALLKEKSLGLASQWRVLADSAPLKRTLDSEIQDPATTKDMGQEFKDSLRLDLLQVTGRRGALLASLLGSKAPDLPRPPKNAKPEDKIFAAAIDKASLTESMGAWASQDTLYETVTGPVVIQNSVLGALRIGFAMDNKFAAALDVTVLVNGKVFASSLKPEELSQLTQVLNTMMGKAGEEGVFTTDLGGRPYFGQFIPIKGPGGEKVADILQLRSKARVLMFLSKLRENFLIIFGSGLFLALLVAFFISRNITKPLDSLIAATRQVDSGNLEVHVEVDTKDELNVLADSFNTMVKDLKEKERVKSIFGRYLPKAVADKVMEQQGELKLGGEQKEVSILFSDIRGFTAISERMSPPELVAMLNDYYTRMIDVLFENGGTLDKTIGDAIMAVFGAPVSDSDSPAKAILTALGMQEALKQFNKDRVARNLEPFEIGIGINTGVVVAGNLGSVKQFSYTVIGEEVNLASRMCSVAKKGQIIVTESTYRKTKWLFEFNRMEPVTVKNVSQPVQIYEVLGVKKTPAA